jgi:hypothetical protein
MKRSKFTDEQILAHAIRASLLASATATTLGGARASRAVSQAPHPSRDRFASRCTKRAPCSKRRRR